MAVVHQSIFGLINLDEIAHVAYSKIYPTKAAIPNAISITICKAPNSGSAKSAADSAINSDCDLMYSHA